MIDSTVLTLAPAAFLAGVLMFLAPCTLPLVPGYLAFIAGGQGKVVRNAVAFVLGFSVIFILLGMFAGTIGGVLAPWKDFLSRIAGAVIILFGLTMLGLVRLPVLSSERHVGIPKFLSLGSPHSSFLIGALFAIGWSPCIGPILGTILFIASAEATALSGALLLAIFSLGLAIPFILCAIFVDQASTAISRYARATVSLSRVGGALLIGIGALMLMGSMGLLITWGYGLFEFINYDALLKYL
ncbi:MAG TPA: cytochrome c biogenesis protein CcdA [Candidatus Paceibacterota bacterium]|nr:cytochrome c biogenesis protein CcdA [Candidatus Paceibacterota bacterium]